MGPGSLLIRDIYFKAPASFGLVSFLLHQGLDRIRVKRHLAIFALAAPVGAIVTYIVLNMVRILIKYLRNYNLLYLICIFLAESAEFCHFEFDRYLHAVQRRYVSLREHRSRVARSAEP
jgi:hypothetical protein